MVKDLANDENAEAARCGDLDVLGWECLWIERPAIVAQNEAQAVAKPFHFESHGFDEALVRVAYDVRAGLIESHDDSRVILIVESRAR